MNRFAIILVFIMTLTLCGFNTVADSTQMEAPRQITPVHEQAVIKASSTLPALNSVRMKVDAKVYGNPFAEENAKLKPVYEAPSDPDQALTAPQASSSPHQAVSHFAAKRAASSLVALVEKNVTRRYSPVVIMV